MSPFLRRKLFGFVFGLVITVPFILHGIGHKGWDPIGQATGITGTASTVTSVLLEQMAVQTLDPSISEANATATGNGRATQLADVIQALTDNGFIGSGAQQANDPSTTPTDPALSGLNTPAAPPTFSETTSDITAHFLVLGIHGTCVISITNGQASRTCK